MTGRCSTDPLDPADDICVFCGQGYCESCLIRPRQGRGEPVCKGCARANSGIKGARVPGSRPSRAELKRAREELEEYKLHRPPPTFQFFTDAPDFDASQFETGDEPSPSAERRRIRLGIGRRRSDDADDVGPDDELDDRLADATNAAPAAASSEPPGETPPAPGVPTAETLADRLNSARAATLPGGPATEQLMRLKSEGVPPASEPMADDEAPEDAPPAWSLAVSTRPTDRREPPPSHLDAWAPVSAPRTVAPPAAPTNVDPFALGDPFAMAGVAPSPAPSPAPIQAAPTAHPVVPERRASPAQPPTPMPQTVAGPTTNSAAPSSADRDAAGNWIPPILRGIAPDAQQRAGELPRRRSAG